MSEPNTRVVQMPPTTEYPQGHNLPLRDRVLVVIGANGSGKTRFGAWLDAKDIKHHHRVSAHRSLKFPERVQPTDFKDAERTLLFGHPEERREAVHRHHTRWQQNPATALLDDFAPLVTVMISESFAASDQYRVSMKAESKYVAPPKTRMDLVKEIWEAVLPDRELVFTGSRIETRNRKDNGLYHAKEMSDGERGVFHLIGEALSVPINGLFVVDEPELHLHRAIQARLWDAIESARPDCIFVYITHDLGFAASRKDATKVWLREYTNEKWDWVEVPDTDTLPETLLLEVMGSRRPILFVEGDRTSLDYFIYGKLFPEYTVVPSGSCDHVIHSTCSFTRTPALHENRCAGIVDNDGRPESDIEKLNGLGIAVLPVALIENLFLTAPVLRISAEKLGHSPDGISLKIKDRVLGLLEKSAVRVASNLTRQEVEVALRTFGAGDDGAEALSAAFKIACTATDPGVIYEKWEKEIARVIKEKDYAAALRYYNIKGLPSEAGSVFGLNFKDQMMRWLRSKDAAPFVAAFRCVIPSIPERTK